MFAYDEAGNVYLVTDNGYLNVGISVKDKKHSVTINRGEIYKKVAASGRVSTVEELIAKFHVTEDTPISLIQKAAKSRRTR